MISIIIPVYNGERYLRQCLDSIRKQSFDNFEVIAIDDGSSDGTAAILQEYCKTDNRFRFLTVDNGGVSRARNIGMQQMKGDSYTFVDADDYLDQDYLQELYRNLTDTPGADVSVVGMRRIYDDRVEECKVADAVTVMNKTQALDCILDKHRPWVGFACGKLLRNTPPRLTFHEDITLCEDSLFHAQNIWNHNNVVLSDKCLYNYRINMEGTTVQSSSNSKKYFQRAIAYHTLLQSIPYRGTEFEKRTTLCVFTTCIRYLYRFGFHAHDSLLAKQYFKQLRFKVTWKRLSYVEFVKLVILSLRWIFCKK